MQAQFTYTTNHGAITITRYTGSGGAVVIPSSTNGYPVTGIGDSAFGGYTSLTSITIPDSVTSIGYMAFWHCTSLLSVRLGTNVTWIGMSAFYSCTSLSSMTIPDNVTLIGFSAFEACTSLTTVTIGASVTDIMSDAFRSCGSLTGVYFRGDAPSLAPGTFDDDNNATVYYLAGATGWGRSFGGNPAVLWVLNAKTTAASLGGRTIPAVSTASDHRKVREQPPLTSKAPRFIRLGSQILLRESPGRPVFRHGQLGRFGVAEDLLGRGVEANGAAKLQGEKAQHQRHIYPHVIEHAA